MLFVIAHSVLAFWMFQLKFWSSISLSLGLRGPSKNGLTSRQDPFFEAIFPCQPYNVDLTKGSLSSRSMILIAGSQKLARKLTSHHVLLLLLLLLYPNHHPLQFVTVEELATRFFAPLVLSFRSSPEPPTGRDGRVA